MFARRENPATFEHVLLFLGGSLMVAAFYILATGGSFSFSMNLFLLGCILFVPFKIHCIKENWEDLPLARRTLDKMHHLEKENRLLADGTTVKNLRERVDGLMGEIKKIRNENARLHEVQAYASRLEDELRKKEMVIEKQDMFIRGAVSAGKVDDEVIARGLPIYDL